MIDEGPPAEIQSSVRVPVLKVEISPGKRKITGEAFYPQKIVKIRIGGKEKLAALAASVLEAVAADLNIQLLPPAEKNARSGKW